MLSFLARDLWVRTVVFLWVAIATFYLLPSVPSEAKAYFGDFLLNLTFLPFAIGACLGSLKRIQEPNERRFWIIVAGALGTWLLYSSLSFWVPDERWTLTLSVVGDCVYLGYYLLVMLAIELKPQVQMMDPMDAQQRRLRSSAVTLVMFAWLCYLIVIPASVHPAEYDSEIPSFLLYLSLDFAIVLRLLWVRRQSWSVRWATVYGILAVAFGTWFLTDLLEALSDKGVMPIQAGRPFDLLWGVPFIVLIAGVRARHGPFEAGQKNLNEDWTVARLARVDQFLMAAAVALPVAHHTMYGLGLLSLPSRHYRAVLVEVTLIALAALGVIAFRLIEGERKRIEEGHRTLRAELDQARRMDAIARVAGEAAHDFNNVLHVIDGHVDLAVRSLPPEHTANDDLQAIRAAAMRASSLASDLLTFGRRQPVSVKSTSLHAVIDRLRRQLQLMAGEHVALEFELRARTDTVLIDERQFERVLLNLVANARNAIAQSGRIEIQTWNPPALSPAAPRVAVAVKDTGAGMPPDILDKVFEPFFTTRRDAGGSGLGLSSVYGIVRAMGGSIRAQSEQGRGTTMVIDLPIEQPKPDGSADSASPGSLLIVESDTHMRQMLRGYFSGVWTLVLTTGNAMEALQIASTPRQTISVLVTDTMPSGLTYQELIGKLRALHPAMKVVLIVPADFTGAAAGCLVMREPLSLSVLAEQIEELTRPVPGLLPRIP